ncbi:class I SAM-dependent methyltransferase [Nitratireductor sp. StC3]|uniref:class I SAM-dependent methyltransferase n=1 Tax=Nitratireductor sp. StC3 TaxID=2126741 RepID=UPI000D0D8403|nr:class I SAM-dependent methyltransferase [Nitratireductor sp. StC3]PSM20287.1 nodulation protein NoeA [Nitratireductor sp. StC3]
MLERNAGSFRDPSGYVYEAGGSIYRSVAPRAAADYEAARDSGVFDSLVGAEKLVALSEVEKGKQAGEAYLLEHPRLPFISYPYEWSFSLLRDAALFHLDLHLQLLDRGFTLSDASAYNVQFDGPRPIFIDHLSIRRYQQGEFWLGHRQFCEQFLNPLLLRAIFGVAHNSWYRGNLEGIPTDELAKLLSLRNKLSWNVMTHVVVPNRFQQRTAGGEEVASKLTKRSLPLASFKALLKQLRNWIAKLRPDRIGATVWEDYAKNNTYTTDEEAQKRQFVHDFVASEHPASIIDLGCNTGEYSKVALDAGAEQALGFDFDQKALDVAHHRAKEQSLNFLPLFLDAKNPSPSQGWRQMERSGHDARAKADAVLALAFEHHLAIAHNAPLDQVIPWIIDRAPSGILEFVPKDDPTIRQMLALREDIFDEYTKENFEKILAASSRIERSLETSQSGRTVYQYSRHC